MILLVDANLASGERVRQAFEEASVKVPLQTINSGRGLLDYLLPGSQSPSPRPVLIVLDLDLPEKHGLAILAEFLASPLLREIPVVVLASSQEEADILRSYELGALAYLVKPTGPKGYAKLAREIAQILPPPHS